jgi:hypothetical protein
VSGETRRDLAQLVQSLREVRGVSDSSEPDHCHDPLQDLNEAIERLPVQGHRKRRLERAIEALFQRVLADEAFSDLVNKL